MAHTLLFCSTRNDLNRLSTFAVSIGLHIIPMSAETPTVAEDPAQGDWHCYFSVHPRHLLHPYGVPPRYSDALDPLLLFGRGYFDGEDLVLGRIACSSDVVPLYAQTKPYYDKLRRWIGKAWGSRPPGEAAYFGNEAVELRRKGARVLNNPKDAVVQFNVVKIHPASRISGKK